MVALKLVEHRLAVKAFATDKFVEPGVHREPFANDLARRVTELLRGLSTSDHGERTELLEMVVQAQRIAAQRPAGTR